MLLCGSVAGSSGLTRFLLVNDSIFLLFILKQARSDKEMLESLLVLFGREACCCVRLTWAMI